jgi:hypothetical protein
MSYDPKPVLYLPPFPTLFFSLLFDFSSIGRADDLDGLYIVVRSALSIAVLFNIKFVDLVTLSASSSIMSRAYIHALTNLQTFLARNKHVSRSLLGLTCYPESSRNVHAGGVSDFLLLLRLCRLMVNHFEESPISGRSEISNSKSISNKEESRAG